MPIYTKEQAQALLKKVLSYSKADECEVNLGGSEGGNVRYARTRAMNDSWDDEAPRRAYSMGEHVHTDDERPVPLDQFGWWRSLLVRGRPSRS